MIFYANAFFKLKGKKEKFYLIYIKYENGSKLKVNIFVIPLDNSSVKNLNQYRQIISFFNDKYF